METQSINQKEYLKRYLSKDDKEKKKKKKKKLNIGPKTVKIIDDDIDLRNINTCIIDEEISILNTTEDAPQIVGIIDERGPVDFENKQKWKIIADDGTGDIAISKVPNTESNVQKTHKDAEKQDQKEIKKKETSQSKHKTKKKHNSSNSESDSSPRPSKNRDEKIKKRHKKDYNSDQSPPRTSKHSKDSKLKRSSTKDKRNSDSDLSPPRPKNISNHSDSDVSPPRKSKSKNQEKYDSDRSPPRRSQKYDRNTKSKGFDYSPPRKKNRKNNSDSDLSPVRNSKSKNHKQYDSDLSPPRSSKRKDKRSRGNSSDLSPPRRRNRANDSDSDLSPPRHSKTKNNKNYDSDLSPPRPSKSEKSIKRHDLESSSSKYDYSRQERHYRSKENNYPRQRPRSSRWDEGSRKSRSPSIEKSKEKPKKMTKTLDGTSAGLQNLKSLKEEEEAQKKRETEMMKKMSKEMSGKGQFAVIRDRKTGRKRDLEKEAAESREKQKIQDEIDEKYEKWGKGLKQTEDYRDKIQRDLYEMSKPLARYADDEDLERELKARDREDDPMLAYIKEKEIKEGKRAPEKPSYSGSFMPNRFNIKPGCRWDGVDRSNGYEKKWFERQNAKKAIEDEAYKWSTADM